MNVNTFLSKQDNISGFKKNISITRDELETIVKEFAYIKCKEQIMVCADNLKDPTPPIYYNVMTAPVVNII